MRAGGTQVWRFARPKGSPPPEHLWSDHGRVVVKCCLRGLASTVGKCDPDRQRGTEKAQGLVGSFPPIAKGAMGGARGSGGRFQRLGLGWASFIPWSPNARDQGHPAQDDSLCFDMNFRGRTLACGGSTHFFKGCREARSENLLRLWSELFAVAGQVEDVNGGFAFGVNEGNLDVALHG